jgi:septal ring factor EnvC (AmiA/AmiB activator)
MHDSPQGVMNLYNEAMRRLGQPNVPDLQAEIADLRAALAAEQEKSRVLADEKKEAVRLGQLHWEDWDRTEKALAAEREAHERTKAALSARDSFSAFAVLHPKELAEALTNEAREQAREAEAALARADALARCVKRVVRQMTHRLDTMTATGEDFTEADVKRWRDKLAAYLHDRKGGAA